MVSIIMPCHNASDSISDSIESVLSQTYENWELIIVDDCSSDDSKLIINAYTEQDKRIKYFRTDMPSGSPSLPRNIGIDKSIGNYIAFLDSDDLWLPHKLEQQISYIKNKNVKFVYSYYEKITHDGVRTNRVVRTNTKTTYESLLKSNSIPCLTALLSKSMIGSTRFRNIPQEDFCFWLDILSKGGIAYSIEENTALYRVSDNSRSANKLAMFLGYWNVIRNQQHINLLKSSYCMLTYTVLGILKYLK